MNTNYDKIKSDLLDFGKRNSACIGQYQRLYKAESIEDVISVVKDNFEWCIKYKDFADVLMANREQFAEHRIWINQNVEIQEGVGFLLVTEGSINAESYGTSTINAESCDTSTINAKSCDTSTINVKSYGTSTINAESYGTSTINAESLGSSTINAESYGTSTINAESWDTSTINAKSCDTSTINAESLGSSMINAESWDTSTINAESCDTSTINAESCNTSTINVKSWGTSTMVIHTLNIECEVNDRSIARYIYDNRIVIADTSVTVEQYHK